MLTLQLNHLSSQRLICLSRRYTANISPPNKANVTVLTYSSYNGPISREITNKEAVKGRS